MSDEERWIVIPNWKKFQHYTDRAPLWIKVYLELENRDEWMQISLADRGLLVSIWVAIASTSGQIRTSTLHHRVGHRVRIDSLERLSDAGFIELVASKPEKLRYQVASAEKRQRENPLTPPEWGISNNDKPKNSRAHGTNPRALAKTDKEHAHQELLAQAGDLATSWDGTDSLQFDQALDGLEQLIQARLSHVEREDLWEQAFNGF